MRVGCEQLRNGKGLVKCITTNVYAAYIQAMPFGLTPIQNWPAYTWWESLSTDKQGWCRYHLFGKKVLHMTWTYILEQLRLSFVQCQAITLTLAYGLESMRSSILSFGVANRMCLWIPPSKSRTQDDNGADKQHRLFCGHKNLLKLCTCIKCTINICLHYLGKQRFYSLYRCNYVDVYHTYLF